MSQKIITIYIFIIICHCFFSQSRGKKKTEKSYSGEVVRRSYVITGKKKTILLCSTTLLLLIVVSNALKFFIGKSNAKYFLSVNLMRYFPSIRFCDPYFNCIRIHNGIFRCIGFYDRNLILMSRSYF